MESDTKMVLDQLEKDSNDIMNLLKKERAERERDSNLIKERIDNEKKELQVRNARFEKRSILSIFQPLPSLGKYLFFMALLRNVT